MSKIPVRVAALVAVLLALHSIAVPARTRTMMCAICGTVIDADPIWYARDKLPAGAAAGTIIGARVDGPKASDNVADHGLIGRNARTTDQGNDARGLRLEIRMDAGGRRFIEVGEGTRVYRRDRVRVHSDRLEVFD